MPGGQIVNENFDFPIMLPKQVAVTSGWTGYFTADSKQLANTGFAIVQVNGNRATGMIAATKLTSAGLPSSTVRLFAPGYVQ